GGAGAGGGGRTGPAAAGLGGLPPSSPPADPAHAGCRDDAPHLAETSALLGAVIPASQIRRHGVPHAARTILGVAGRAGLDGYWIHLDVDILDPAVMPAVDSPDPGGLSAAELTELLAALAPRAPAPRAPSSPPPPPPAAPPPPPPPDPPPPAPPPPTRARQ